MGEKLNVLIIIYLDDIFIYIENKREGQIEAVWLVFDQLRKHSFHANLKKCQFHHQEEVRFLGYIVFHQDIQIEKKEIKAVCD